MHTIAPTDGYYAHDDMLIRTENLTENEPANAPAHIAHVFVGKASDCVPITRNALQLGDGQRVERAGVHTTTGHGGKGRRQGRSGAPA